MKKTLLTTLITLPFAAHAVEDKRFYHEDWQVICDNTGTCRAAGYQNEDNDSRDYPLSISMLITRAAGENAPVEMKIQAIPEVFEKPEDLNFSATLSLNGKALGDIALQKGIATLSDEHKQTLLKALTQKADIRLKQGDNEWLLSDRGSTAVLLKMDEFQKRVDTPSAIVKPGQNKNKVLEPQQKPVIKVPKVSTTFETVTPEDARYQDIKKHLLALGGEDCDDMENLENSKSPDIRLHPLNDNTVLAEAFCWNAAYNEGYFYALLSKDLKTAHSRVGEHESNGYDSGIIFGSMKGRGLGDCWSLSEYAWNGKTFQLSSQHSTGLCRGFPGGAWEMPTFVSEVVMQE